MSGKQPEQHHPAWEDALDPSLRELSEEQLAPLLLNQLVKYNRGHGDTFPSISPYSADCYPELTNPNAAHPQDIGNFGHYGGHQHEQTIPNDEPVHSPQESPSVSRESRQPQDSHPQQHHQSRKRHRSGSSSAEYAPVSIEDRSRPFISINDVAAEYCANLIAVSGVKIPSKHGPLSKPLQPSYIPEGNDLTCFCPVCGAGYAQITEVWSHFVACVARNGNPNGARWDDELETGHSKVLEPSHRWKEMKEKLDAVNGVVVPSKLAEGELPILRTQYQSTAPRHIACPICTALFAKRDHLKSHFPSCVNLNGNPNGLTWDHGLPELKRGPIAKPYPPKYPICPSQPSQPLQPSKPPRPSNASSNSSRRAISNKTRLDAVNGIVIPSKIAPGQWPLTLPSQANAGAPLHLSCPRCQSRFSRADHVRSHFPVCVDRNGNPEGLRWNDGLPYSGRVPLVR